MDLRGTFHNTTDLDDDGDLDVILAQTRLEGEDINAGRQVCALTLRCGNSYVPEDRLFPLNDSWIWFNEVKPDELFGVESNDVVLGKYKNNRTTIRLTQVSSQRKKEEDTYEPKESIYSRREGINLSRETQRAYTNRTSLRVA